MLPVGAAAAVLGGIIWTVKGGSIILTGRDVLVGVDLGHAFVTFQGLFALTVIGISELVVARSHPGDVAPGGRRTAIGRWFAWLGLGLAVVVAVLWALDGLDEGAVASFAAVGTTLGWMAGAGLVGLSALRRRALVGPWRWVPFGVGVAAVPLFIAFGLASNFLGERWLEVPVVAVGLAWIAFGVSLIRGEAIPNA